MLCCFTGWRRLVCYLDNGQHAVLRRWRLTWLCDVHDRLIVGNSQD